MKVVPHPFLGGIGDDDDDPAAVDLGGSASDDEELPELGADKVTPGWSPESVAGRNEPRNNEHAAFLAEKVSDVNKFEAEMEWEEAEYDADDEDWAVNYEMGGSESEYSGPQPHGGGLSKHWFDGGGKLKWSERDIFDSLKIFFQIVPFSWFQTLPLQKKFRSYSKRTNGWPTRRVKRSARTRARFNILTLVASYYKLQITHTF